MNILIKYREVATYIFFGFFTFITGMSTYILFNVYLGMDALLANVFSWIFAVLIAFITNQRWVFRSYVAGWRDYVKQMAAFYTGRVATLLIEEIILFIFVTWMGLGSVIVKLFAEGVVIVMNYCISKWVVFRKKSDRFKVRGVI
ncbi:MAG: GtrA family protein [Veillonellaceae bacterium]|nr:GtrA family protein [Veillonellaceae bacterium]